MEIMGKEADDSVEAQVNVLGRCAGVLDGSVRGSYESVPRQVQCVQVCPNQAVVRYNTNLPARRVHTAQSSQPGKESSRDGGELRSFQNYLLDVGQRFETVRLDSVQRVVGQ